MDRKAANAKYYQSRKAKKIDEIVVQEEVEMSKTKLLELQHKNDMLELQHKYEMRELQHKNEILELQLHYKDQMFEMKLQHKDEIISILQKLTQPVQPVQPVQQEIQVVQPVQEQVVQPVQLVESQIVESQTQYGAKIHCKLINIDEKCKADDSYRKMLIDRDELTETDLAINEFIEHRHKDRTYPYENELIQYKKRICGNSTYEDMIEKAKEKADRMYRDKYDGNSTESLIKSNDMIDNKLQKQIDTDQDSNVYKPYEFYPLYHLGVKIRNITYENLMNG